MTSRDKLKDYKMPLMKLREHLFAWQKQEITMMRLRELIAEYYMKHADKEG